MSSDEVRLLSDNDCLWIRADDAEDPSGTLSEYIALPAARHAALMRVVKWAKEWARCYDKCAENDVDYRKARVNLSYAVADLNATAPERRGESPRA